MRSELVRRHFKAGGELVVPVALSPNTVKPVKVSARRVTELLKWIPRGEDVNARIDRYGVLWLGLPPAAAAEGQPLEAVRGRASLRPRRGA